MPKTHSKWALWEKKNLNIHRGLIGINSPPVKSIHDLARQVREGVRDEFRPNWFRGFGFGTIIRFQEVPSDFSEICQHIDTRNKKGGVWQWAVVCLEEDKVAIAIHTWLHGYLRPVYDSVLEQLAANGYQCHASDAEMDALIAKLQKIADTCRMIQRVAGVIT
ncbi:MAG: hypothetical protein IT423_20425 [Pirellulaceae bacterium]|nr:hypothetical protein [Pirellulaceae bacterium]